MAVTTAVATEALTIVPMTVTPAVAVKTLTVASVTTALAPAAFVATVAAIGRVLVLMRPQNAPKHGKAAFLSVGETLVQRRARIGDVLESGTGLGHVVGPARHPIERRGRGRGRGRLIFRLTGLSALSSELDHVAQSLLECRPVLCLVGRQFEAGLERGDTRITERSDILGARLVALLGTGTVAGAAMAAETVLRID
jgi:hypothetical protein